MRKHHRIWMTASVSAMLAAGLAAPGAFAQADGGDEEAQGRQAIDEVVVIARKREENLQDVPVAVSTISNDELQARNIVDIEGLEAITPNLVIQPNLLSAAGANIFIRGLGQGDFDRTFNPAVQVLFDEVRYGSGVSGQLLSVVDAERIEVLRGPQGTLFGANAIGGVINIIRPRPEDELGGQVRVTAGNFGQRDLRATLTGPLVEDKLSGRIALVSLKSDGPFFNEFDLSDRGGRDILSISPSLMYTPTDNATFLLNYDYMRNQSDWGMLQNRSNENDLLCLGILLSQEPRCDDPDRDLTVFNQNTPTFLDIQSHFGTFRAEIEFGSATFTSISGYSHVLEDKQTDFDAVPIDVFASIQPVEEEIFSQEFRLDWSPVDNLDVLFGLFASKTDYSDGANSLFVFDLLGFPENTIEVVSKEQQTEMLGAFVSADWRFADQWTLSVGGRYSWEEKDFAYRNGFNQVGGGFFPDAPGFDNVAEGVEDWGQFTPRVSLQYEPRTDVLVYASYAQGFKSGGFNGRGNSTDTIGPYDEELVDSYELGVKSQWLDDTVRLNLTGFYMDYADKQEEIIRTNPETGATITLVDNAAAVQISGIEAEWIVRATEGLTLSGTGSYLSSEYEDFLFDGFNVADFVDVRNAPEFQYTLNAQYDFEVENLARFETLVAYRWTDSYQTNLGPRFDGGGPSPLINDPRALVDSFGILDASVRARFDLPSGAEADILFFVNNATDEVFYSSFYPVANLWNMSGVSMPRSYGVQFGVQF